MDWDDKPGLPRVVIPVGFGVFGFLRPENPETDWDDKAGLPRVVIPVRFWVFRPFRPENPETEWGDKPGLPRLVIPVRFRFFAAFFSPKTTKRIGMTSLGFPRLSSQSVSGFFGPVLPENPETDWDDKHGFPRVVIPVRFGIIWPFSARKPQNGLG